eukprot:CAMPEP_0184752394 /NCGR_PEP_ID=MMETSP0315-20130426/43553_1 /TAXON_ID=101924 /ORGANISM="Rhodosorus marinus, Strain UTEX LB 2760" /LENGTH=125 /DNA_ID=CAMNT_0027231723 /DNA_START=1920 /DNA_END=2297 /DNA_ORIENTATION=-
MAMWLSRVYKDGSSVLRLCGRYQKAEGRADADEVGGAWWKGFIEEDMAKFLSDVDNVGLSVVGLCAQGQSEGETLTKLAEFWETYLSGARDGQMVVGRRQGALERPRIVRAVSERGETRPRTFVE